MYNSQLLNAPKKSNGLKNDEKENQKQTNKKNQKKKKQRKTNITEKKLKKASGSRQEIIELKLTFS